MQQAMHFFLRNTVPACQTTTPLCIAKTKFPAAIRKRPWENRNPQRKQPNGTQRKSKKSIVSLSLERIRVGKEKRIMQTGIEERKA